MCTMLLENLDLVNDIGLVHLFVKYQDFVTLKRQIRLPFPKHEMNSIMTKERERDNITLFHICSSSGRARSILQGSK